MIAFIYIISLAVAAASVSSLGAVFSIKGLARLFAGSALAVSLMAAALEFSKFVVAAFLHRLWKQLNPLYRTYLLVSVVVLSLITSMGIFGFLSDAYQTSSLEFAENQIRIEALKTEQMRNTEEIARINRSIEEIPANRVTKKIQARQDAEKFIRKLTQKSDQIAEQMKQMNLKTLDVSQKVGPLIYVSRAFHQDIDTVVKWLILVFVTVFDPLAICLVIATSEALRLKSRGYFDQKPAVYAAPVAKPIVSVTPVAAETAIAEEEMMPVQEAQEEFVLEAEPLTTETPVEKMQEPVMMRFADEDSTTESKDEFTEELKKAS